MAADVTITGDKKIDRKLNRLTGSGQRRVARSGLGKGMTVLSRGIRNAIPPKYKSAKKTIGRRNKRNKTTKKHEAIVGLGVGKRRKSKKQRNPSKPGVGISRANIHWLVFGTPERKGPRGAMPNIGQAGGWVQKGVSSVEAEAVRVMKDQMRNKVLEEVKKG